MMLHAEVMKASSLSSTKIAIVVGALGLLLTQLSFVYFLPALAASSLAGDIGSELGAVFGGVDPSSARYQLDALSLFGSNGAGSIGLSMVGVLALGVLIATTDFRFGGIVSTTLAEPRRGRIVLAKLGATTVWAIALSLVYAAICVIVLMISLAATPGAELALTIPEIASVLGRGILAMTLLAWCALALGLAIRGQLAAFLVLISLIVVEPFVHAIAQLTTGGDPLWAQFLPVSLAQSSIGVGGGGLDPLVAIAGLGALAIVALGLSFASFSRRDL